MSTAQTATDLLIARQPVHDPALRVAAYELLVQRRDGSSVEGEAETSSVITELGLSLVVGHLAYIPLSRSFLLEGYATALPAERVMLKVPAELQLDLAAVNALRELSDDGYRLVLDRLEPGDDPHPLLDVATVVGFDVRALDRGLLRQRLARLAGGDAKLLAQNVEDHEALEFCRAEGFELFQGYFFCQPRVVSERGVQVSKINRMQLAAVLQSTQVQFDEIQDVISRDVGLSYNLLRFINSAFFSLPRRVESIRDAVVLLGVLNVRKWATLMALADCDDKPRELVVTALVRARMCELVAGAYGYEDAQGFFTTGLFSVVDALTDTSMVELLVSLPLSQEIIKALLNYEGSKGEVLRAVIAYERGNFAELGSLMPTSTPLSELYASSVAWATEATGVI